jgi:hypothetical protein
VVGLILGYAKTWLLLLDYDEGRLELPTGVRSARGVLDYGQARRARDALAGELRQRVRHRAPAVLKVPLR